MERREAVTVTDESSFLLLAAVLSLYYTRWQCCHVPGMYPVFPAERSRMLLMLIGSFSQQAPPCAPANNKRPRCLLRLINQTNATGGTKHVCKCTWAFLTCLPVYMEGGSGGFMHLCVCDWGQTSCMELPANGPSELYDRILLFTRVVDWSAWTALSFSPPGFEGRKLERRGAGWRKHLQLQPLLKFSSFWNAIGAINTDDYCYRCIYISLNHCK